jgi:putative FmdB family regulatory protein
MPIYEYKCENGHVFDVMQRMTDEALTECQVCGAPAVRVLHSPAVHFKGSGFYNTDYGKKKGGGVPAEGGNESKSSESSGSSESSDSSSSDSTPSDSKSSDSKSSDSKPKAATAD